MKRPRVWLLVLLVAIALPACRAETDEPTGRGSDPGPSRGSVSPATPKAPGHRSAPGKETSSRHPRIAFDQVDADFGQVEAGEEVEHVFTFKNIGEAELSIGKVLSNCGCTGAVVSGSQVPPSGTGQIKVTFRTKGYQGRVKKGIVVETNDPEQPLVRLTIQGTVVSEVTVTPRYLNWGTINETDRPHPKRLTIRFRPGRDLRLLEVRPESQSIVVTKQEKSKDGVVYSVALADKLPSGRFTGRITIRTNSRRVPEIHVPFYAYLQGSVKVTPALVSFAGIRAGEAASRDLLLTRTGEKGFVVKRVKSTSKMITTETIEEEKGGRYRIHVTCRIPAGGGTKQLAERLTILLDDGEPRFIEVPVYGTIQE